MEIFNPCNLLLQFWRYKLFNPSVTVTHKRTSYLHLHSNCEDRGEMSTDCIETLSIDSPIILVPAKTVSQLYTIGYTHCNF